MKAITRVVHRVSRGLGYHYLDTATNNQALAIELAHSISEIISNSVDELINLQVTIDANDDYCITLYFNDINENDKPTQKQLEYIRDIEEFGVGTSKFTGTTKQEASEYISKNKHLLELGLMDSWQINYM